MAKEITEKQSKRLKDDELKQSYIILDEKEQKGKQTITDPSQITNITKSIIFHPETKRQKKDNIHLSKRTKKDILEHPNKIKSKSRMGLLPLDVAAMQADVEFIKQQLQKEKQVNKKNARKNRLNINIPLSFYGQPMRPVKNDIARTSKKAINNQKDKNNIKSK